MKLVYVLFHETNTGHTGESDGYIEGIYATEASAEAARLAKLREYVEEGLAVWSDPDNPDDDGNDEWEHDFIVLTCEVKP